MNIKHPYIGHYMEPAFMGFVSFASKHMLMTYFLEMGEPDFDLDEMGEVVEDPVKKEKEVQRFVDWCLAQFGTPEQIGAA